MDEGIKKQILGTVFKFLNPEECVVLLFGSEALGEATSRSDIDIGIDCVSPIPDATFLELQDKLNEEVSTLRKIELVELSTLDEDFLAFALKGAILWHVGKDYLRNWIKQKEPSRN